MPHIADNYTAKGAERLKNTILDYWATQGYTNVRVEKYEVWDGVWGLQSNLVNGLPPADGRGRYLKKRGKRILTPRIGSASDFDSFEAVKPTGRAA
jgi:hypothetical protein